MLVCPEALKPELKPELKPAFKFSSMKNDVERESVVIGSEWLTDGGQT